MKLSPLEELKAGIAEAKRLGLITGPNEPVQFKKTSVPAISKKGVIVQWTGSTRRKNVPSCR